MVAVFMFISECVGISVKEGSEIVPVWNVRSSSRPKHFKLILKVYILFYNSRPKNWMR